MNHPLDPPATRLRAIRKASRMPVSKLRFGHKLRARNPKDTTNPYTAAGRLLYDRLIAAVTGIRHDITMEIMLRREVVETWRRKRLGASGVWFTAGPTSREAKRRQGQKLVQHPSVVARFPRADRAEIEALAGA